MSTAPDDHRVLHLPRASRTPDMTISTLGPARRGLGVAPSEALQAE